MVPAPRHRPEESSLAKKGCLISVPTLSPTGGQQSLRNGTQRERHHPLLKSGHILSKGMLLSQEALPLLTHVTPSLSQLGCYPKGAPGVNLLPILLQAQKEFDQTQLPPTFPVSSPSIPLNPTSSSPSLSLDGMKHRQTHPRGRQLVRAETVIEREGERW